MPTPYALSSDLVSAWPAKSLEIATYLDTALASKTDLAMTQNAQTDVSYSYALADASNLLTMSNASANTVLVTKQATVTWVTGTQLRVLNLGAGVTTLVADTGVTINGNVSLKQYQGGTLIRTASDVWAFMPNASAGGIDLITPTSVAGTGVTLSGGKVSFSAATTVSVNGCFTATYDNYRFELVTTASSADTQLSYRSRLAGTDNSSANYNSQMLQGATSAAAASASTGATSWRFSDVGSANENICSGDIFSPFIARATAFNNVRYASAGSNAINAGAMTVTTSYDGFTIFPAAGNITGTLRIYGLRNS